MKIVQSQWTKPGKKNNQLSADDNKGGWLEKKYNYFSWALSVLQLKKYYNNIELVTDKAGYDLLINKLELPYDSVKTVLDELNVYPEELFMMGKVYAYSIQDEPFIHVDSDVFIWDKFDSKLENSPLICQSKEDEEFYNQHYFEIFYPMLKNFEFCPPYLEKSMIKNGRIVAVNAGIIGGQNFDFYKNYKDQVFEFVERNVAHFEKVELKKTNIVFEQFLFHAMAEEQLMDINYLSLGNYTFLSDILDFTGVPEKIKYMHLYAGHKKVKLYLDGLEYRLQKDHPAYYYKIINLLKTNQI